MNLKKCICQVFLLAALSMACLQSFGQVRAVSGTVTDAAGEPMLGVSVTEKGNNSNGSITDSNGRFTVNNLNANSRLVFTYIGYVAQEVAVGQQTSVNITLQEDLQALDEVVVVGYGTMKRRDLTGSVASVKSTDIEQVSSSNAMQAMQAKIPGLDITQSDGQAGGGLNITLRGNRSIVGSNSPLILVDGIEYGSTIDLNATDIESMEVLKDAASTAIYGTRGANGVILITTKRGAAGRTKVNLNSFVSINSPTHIPEIKYGEKQVQMYIDATNYANDLISGNWGTSSVTAADVLTYNITTDLTEMDIYNNGSYTDWLDVILQNGMTQNYVASVSGGNEKTTFNLSVGAMDEEGIMKSDNLNRYNVRLNVDHKINNYFKVGGNIMYSYRTQNRRYNSVFSTALKMTSITHPYDSSGEMIMTPNPRYVSHVNPLADEVENAYVNQVESNRMFGNVYLELTPVKGMNFKTTFAPQLRNARTGIYADYNSVARFQSGKTSTMSQEYDKSVKYTWNNVLSYNTNFDGSKHDVTAMVGHEMWQDVDEWSLTEGDAGQEHYFKNLYYDLSKIASPKTTSGYTKTAMLSYFGRLNYKFDEKYLLQASMRADGSSTLSPGHKWGYFPSLAAAWRISEESFMENTKDWLSNLKARVSWGVSGNAAVDAYMTLSQLSPDNIYYYLGSNVVGKVPSQMGNTDLKWETTRAWDLGLDFGLFGGRVNGSIDYYLSHTSDLLYLRALPASSVFPTVLSNVGETKGHGLEIALNTLVVKTKTFSYDINWSYSTMYDEVVALSDGLKQNISGRTGQIVGQPVSIYYDYETDGCWNVGEYDKFVADWNASHPTTPFTAPLSAYGQPGTVKVVDQNGDGVIDENDKKVYNRSPKHLFGMSNTFSYKNLSLSVLLYARLGGIISYSFNNQIYYDGANWADLDYWTPSNTGARFPSPGLSGTATSTYSTYATALQYEKADYLKIKDITLNYNLPKGLLKGIGISGANVYASLKNFFTFSGIDNYDPERGGSYEFPLSKQAVFGLNINF
ncbi:MAG: TonB-dependent receptor [Dysgonamonadaceae bacterium]|jgi:TonB-linked SusC/RagA family outer membrane protein|nr:TonB-dependent receptor [Dysgonamonadaceae bacterium]